MKAHTNTNTSSTNPKKKEDIMSTINKEKEEKNTKISEKDNDIDFHGNVSEDDENENVDVKKNLVSDKKNDTDAKPKKLKDLFSGESQPQARGYKDKDNRSFQKKTATSTTNQNSGLEKPKFFANENKTNKEFATATPTGKNVVGSFAKPQFTANANKQNPSLSTQEGTARPATTTTTTKKPEFTSSKPNNIDETVRNAQKNVAPKETLVKPQFAGKIDARETSNLPTPKVAEVKEVIVEEIEKRTFTSKNKDTTYVDINLNEDLYLKKMKELGIENEHVEYSIKKEKREGEESTKQKNPKYFESNEKRGERGDNYNKERNTRTIVEKTPVNDGKNYDSDGFEIISHEEKEKKPRREYKPRGDYKQRDGEFKPREQRERNNEDYFKAATKQDGDNSEEGVETKPREFIKREYKPREGGDYEKRNFEKREGGDYEKKEYKQRDGTDFVKREYKPREGGDNKERNYHNTKPTEKRKQQWGDLPNEEKTETTVEVKKEVKSTFAIPKGTSKLSDLWSK